MAIPSFWLLWPKLSVTLLFLFSLSPSSNELSLSTPTTLSPYSYNISKLLWFYLQTTFRNHPFLTTTTATTKPQPHLLLSLTYIILKVFKTTLCASLLAPLWSIFKTNQNDSFNLVLASPLIKTLQWLPQLTHSKSDCTINSSLLTTSPNPILPYLCDLSPTILSLADLIPSKTIFFLSLNNLAHLFWLLQNRTLFNQVSANMFTSLFTSLLKFHLLERPALIALSHTASPPPISNPLYTGLLTLSFPEHLFSNMQSDLLLYYIYCSLSASPTRM